MRAIYIVVEGQTEEEFVNNLIRKYFLTKNIYDVRAIGMKGNVRYSRYKINIINLLKSQSDILVTSLIDFFHLHTDFPKYYESLKILSPVERVEFLEKSCSEDINELRYIPYIQLHEFEGLLFTKMDGFELIPAINNDPIKISELQEILINYPNPELINEGSITAPSKRLSNIIPGYRKPLYGPIIALENTLESVLEKCPRFKNWIDTLIDRMYVS
ncbi:MAG: DUF4276 family protein [Ignavibacteria bacterium]|nr:DUF4276 family protein [Ignavibacteria bacterium]